MNCLPDCPIVHPSFIGPLSTSRIGLGIKVNNPENTPFGEGSGLICWKVNTLVQSDGMGGSVLKTMHPNGEILVFARGE
jgi:hypothetical protein